ncbi:lytic transglycosylase domain-containing protein [Primorskyibacter sp. S87]|uniref:lytic transglycosylase domain-containing protein n=1 Tax=Primorskyibacter sp. S87 TaxID=3415126 RepID=UPI003C7A3E49
MPRIGIICRRAILTLAICAGLGSAIQGHASTSDVCDRAAQDAAARYGVPLDVLRAITRTETGRNKDGRLQPWPWTVNMEGTGRWFGTEDEARSYVFRHYKRGARSFDVGCFQINYKWHGSAFRSIEEMFDPAQNADYAARFLSDLHRELGDWSSAAGAYHSRTKKYADRYVARFDRIRSRLNDLPALPAQESDSPRHSPQPLLVARAPLFSNTGSSASLGSLVPMDSSPGNSLIALN